MCGICGIAQADRTRNADISAVERMNSAITHRGPDDEGLWNGGHAALAMRRLSIIDIEGGRQPMSSEDGSTIVVFNGEIYNFQAIRRELEADGFHFNTSSDTEVILNAYLKWGDDALRRFNGMFAIAICDLNADRLLLARDRLGIKPLFYSFQNDTLVFSSELDSLMRSGLVNGKINPAAIDAYFTYLYIPGPDSIFENVSKLRPGEKLVFEKGKLKTEPYWNLSFDVDDSWTLDSAAERYAELLRDSVRLRMISDVPLGAFLSGGLDSSSVVAAMSAQSARPVKTYCIGFDDSHADELKYARIAARHFATDHTETVLKPEMIDMTSKLARHFGEPFADSSAVPAWLVSQVASNDVTVALAGDGGDELFAGYTWLHMTKHVDAFRRVPAPLRNLLGATLKLAPRSPFVQKLIRFNSDASLSQLEGFRRRETCFAPELRAELYGKDLAIKIGETTIDRFQEHADAAAGFSNGNRMLYLDTKMYLPGDILTKVDRTSMANGLEARAPLLDHRLIEFAATLPFHLKYNNGTSKIVAKHAMAGILPKELTIQRKQGFAIPIHRWFREDLRGYFNSLVLSDESRSSSYLNPGTIKQIANAHTSGRENYGHHLWTLLMFEQWLRYIETIPGLSLS